MEAQAISMALDFSVFTTVEAWVALATLTALEVVLGIDNIVFISILTDKLPAEQQPKARKIGLALALLSRIALLFGISWVVGLTGELFAVFGHGVSGRDLILAGGGLFLIAKATFEIFENLEVEHEEEWGAAKAGAASLGLILFQIMLLDVVFSLDSVITAVGMARDLIVMVIAVLVAIVVMLVFVDAISDFVNRHPSMKILALSFLLLVGVMLVAESAGQHVNKGYIYFAMAFSLVVELVNMRVRRARRKPLKLRGPVPHYAQADDVYARPS